MKGYNPRECLKDGSAIAFIIAITIACIVLILYFAEPNNKPAWIQSIGSIAAIILVFLVATFQTERNLIQARQLKEEDQQKEIEKVYGIVAKSFLSYEYLVKIVTQTKAMKTPEEIETIYSPFYINWRAYIDTIAYLKRIDLLAFPDYITFINITSYIDAQSDTIEEIKKFLINKFKDNLIDIDKINFKDRIVINAIATDIHIHDFLVSTYDLISKFHKDVYQTK